MPPRCTTQKRDKALSLKADHDLTARAESAPSCGKKRMSTRRESPPKRQSLGSSLKDRNKGITATGDGKEVMKENLRIDGDELADAECL